MYYGGITVFLFGEYGADHCVDVFGYQNKRSVLLDWTNPIRQRLIISAFFGFLTFSIMYNPFHFEGMRLDLREVPLFFISYVGGWQYGVISAILPISFRAYLGGPTVVLGILQSIILPIVVGSLFHERKGVNHFFGIVDIKRMMLAFVVFESIKSVWMIFSTPANLLMLWHVSIFSRGNFFNGIDFQQ
ncbi:hypothetical protein BB776_05675 [Planococcus salinarum]|uniref:Signal transduction histidine kinase 5TM receptor LytS transmembrane region domain-containing protein n=1 Tax=Planococcus salinarum TaxID=622695 RepID=A0ABX3D1N7_9BACL|nr:LytS/YhcK type 5TM receptor domain-containing protein [Planococcus salinarum]OHX54602.1 hypothetical protein BB776_05675 [Planococcus salinarum]